MINLSIIRLEQPLNNILYRLQKTPQFVTMDRDIKVFNRPIMQKIQKRNQHLHEQRLKNIKSGFSNRTMPTSTFYSAKNTKINNKKAYLMEEEKNLEIQKQNVILFNKMMKIMQRPDPHQPVNHQTRNLYNSRQRFQSQQNRNALQTQKLSQQNRSIFDRLQKQKPTISNKKLLQDRNKNLHILRFLGKYPNEKAQRMSFDGSTNNGNSRATGDSTRIPQIEKNQEQRQRKLNTTLYFKYNRQYQQDHQEDEQLNIYANEDGLLDEEMYDAQMRKYQNEIKKIKERDHQTSFNKRRFMSQSMKRKPNLDSEQSQMDANLPNLPKMATFHKSQHRKVSQELPVMKNNNQDNSVHQIFLFDCFTKINEMPAQVKFTRTFDSYLIRASFNSQVQGVRETYEVVIPEKEGNQFFSEFNYQYIKIAKLLMIQDDQLVIHVGLQNKHTHDHEQNKQKCQNRDKIPSPQQKNEQKEEEPERPTQSNIQNIKIEAQYQEDLQMSID